MSTVSEEAGWIREILEQKHREVRKAQIALHLAIHIRDAYQEAHSLSLGDGYTSDLSDAERAVADAHAEFTVAKLKCGELE